MAVVAAAAVPSAAAPPLLINDSIMCINIYAEGIRRQERERDWGDFKRGGTSDTDQSLARCFANISASVAAVGALFRSVMAPTTTVHRSPFTA